MCIVYGGLWGAKSVLEFRRELKGVCRHLQQQYTHSHIQQSLFLGQSKLIERECNAHSAQRQRRGDQPLLLVVRCLSSFGGIISIIIIIISTLVSGRLDWCAAQSHFQRKPHSQLPLLASKRCILIHNSFMLPRLLMLAPAPPSLLLWWNISEEDELYWSLAGIECANVYGMWGSMFSFAKKRRILV